MMESILNVDDYGPGRYARTRVLQQGGFSVQEAATGKEALELAARHSPPLILLDVNLPDMSGIEVCRRMREDPRTVSSTIVHISASNVMPHHQVAGLEGGADSYLVEPIEPTVLIATIKAFMRARQAEEALRRSNEELERFGYRIAHDLAEPLRTIVAHAQRIDRILGPESGEKVSDSVHFVVDGAQRMQRFVDSLLQYSLITHASGQVTSVDCEKMLSIAIADLASAIESSGACITCDPMPRIVAGAGIEQVFQNLIVNSIKYHRRGVRPEIHVSARSDEDSWIFSVRDNGVGIEERYREDVFEPFRRLHGRDIPGNGIGLATCKKIVEANGGSIWVESQVGVGSVFYFKVPRVSDVLLSRGATEA
jgi:signal transduction histidine kinase